MGKNKLQKKKTHQKKIGSVAMASNDDVMNIIKIAIIVLLIFAIVYIFTALVTGNLNFGNKKKDNNEITIQYEEILAGESFNQQEDEYLVLFYDSSASDAGIYDSLLTSYKSKSNALKYYKVDMSNGLNKIYKTEEASNISVDGAQELKINGPVLVQFTNKKVATFYEGKDAILEYFNEFGK